MKSAVLSGGPRCPSGPNRALRRRLDLTFLGWLIPLLLVMAWPTDAHAYAWMIRHGYAKCDTCHSDPSGGEALNQMGRVQSDNLLSYAWDDQGLSSDAGFMYGGLDEPDHFRGGGSVRGMSVYTLKNEDTPSKLAAFPMQMDLYGGGEYGFVKFGASIGLGKIKAGPYNHAAQITRGDEGYALLSRSHWLGFDLGERWLARVGRLNLPFGIRTSEHTLMTRQATQTDRESDQQHGVALSYSGGPWRGEGMFVLGNYQVSPDAYRERGFTGFLEYQLDPKLAVGVSTQVLQSAKSIQLVRQKRTIRHAHGATLRYVPLSPLAVLAEFDVLKTSGKKLGYTGFLTGDYEVSRGIHAAVTAEVLDAGKSETRPSAIPGEGEMMYALWATGQWFFYTHWDLRLDALLRKGGGKSIQAQIHTYF